jgi:hypothetical protein
MVTDLLIMQAVKSYHFPNHRQFIEELGQNISEPVILINFESRSKSKRIVLLQTTFNYADEVNQMSASCIT